MSPPGNSRAHGEILPVAPATDETCATCGKRVGKALIQAVVAGVQLMHEGFAVARCTIEGLMADLGLHVSRAQ
jgi:hypothetical protein